jgi:hypothetical protein
MANKRVLILVAAAVAIIIAGTAVAIPSFTQQIPATQNNSSTSPQGNDNTTSIAEPGSSLKLSSASVPIDIPLERGYENGTDFFFVATDVSDEQIANMLTNKTGFKVNFAPLLAKTPADARGQAYIFENGVAGKGLLGFQPAVVSGKPGDEGYSALHQINFVKWTNQSAAKELKSVDEIMEHKTMGHLTVTQTDVIANHPAIKWDGGSLKIREDRNNITDDSPYVGGQVLNINTENMTVTMVAHRGWGPDGRTIYYTVTDTNPDMPATMMGTVFAPIDEKLATTPVAVDLFQFMNGIKGSGPMGFQAGIGGANPDDVNYSPMWRISFVTWKDPAQAHILETKADINKMLTAGSITLEPAMGGKHVVNCAFFDQQTVFEHMSK